MPYPVYDFGGHGPLMTLAVANGFPPQTYRPLLEPLTDRYRIVALLPRALWNPAPPPESLTSWQDMASDLLSGIQEHGFENVIAIGHSMGGVASMLAVLADPGRSRGLILLDPTFLPPAFLRFIWLMKRLGLGHRIPLAQGARRRRTRFESTEAAFNSWRKRSLFLDWPEDAIRLYAESMTRPAEDGDGVTLTWTTEWEARYYENIMTTSWRYVPRLRGLLPVLAIQGAETNTFRDVSYRRFRRLVPDATMARIEGHGHLFPQSAPDQTRRLIEDWLASAL